MPPFQLVSEFQPTGDQPTAIAGLVDGLEKGLQHQTLLGATGTGKTFSIAQVVQQVQKPTLVLAHNKTLAAQLYAEFKEFFPKNAVEYFVSYYDYYQPEAYVPRMDLHIEKETQINEQIDRLRLAATASLFSRPTPAADDASAKPVRGQLGSSFTLHSPSLRTICDRRLRRGGRVV